MKYVIGKFEETLQDKRAYFFIVLIMFCVGLSFGVYLVKYMGQNDKNDLINYFNDFTKTILDQHINYIELLKSAAKKNLILLVPIIVLGFTFVGFPFILFIDLLKGFVLGYTFSFVVYAYKGKGMLLAIGSVLPQNLFYIPCFIVLSVICLHISSEKFKSRFFKATNKENLNSIELFGIFFIIIILFCMGTLIETYAIPSIIRLIVK